MPHIHERIDFAADVFIVHGNKVLLRKHDKYKIWLGVGGHIELDEDPNHAAVREAKEEVGLDIVLAGKAKKFKDPHDGEELIVPAFLNRHPINDSHEHISFIYFATSKSADFVQGPDEISDEIRWFTRDDLDNPKFGIGERIKHYAKRALEELAH